MHIRLEEWLFSSYKLQCSRRQLQRVVKKLDEQGVLVKRGKGRYQLSGFS